MGPLSGAGLGRTCRPIQRLLLETWLDAYGSFIPREDLVGYLNTQYSQAKLEALFADPDVTGLVAEVDGAVVGYAKLYHARAEQRFYVHQLYILPARQGLGLGHRLMACAEERARELGADRIWLGVMVKNTQAVAWYKKMGFTVTETAPVRHGFNHRGSLHRLSPAAAAQGRRATSRSRFPLNSNLQEGTERGDGMTAPLRG